MIKLWNYISILGLRNKNFSYSETKTITLVNQINFILLLISISLSIFLAIMREIENSTITFASIRIFLFIVICSTNILLAKLSLFKSIKITLIFIPAFIFFILSSAIGFIEEESFFYYPYVAIAFSVLIQLILNPKEEKILYISSLIYYLLITFFAYDILTYFASHKYQAAILIEEFNIYYKIVALVIFIFIHSTIHYLRILNSKYENKINSYNKELEETNKKLIAKNETIANTMEKLKNTQATLVQSEKMASLGILTAGIAHEINNPLNFIMGGYQGIEKIYEQENKRNENINILLQSIKVGIDRASDIVKSLNQFSRNNEAFSETCNIHKIINSCLTMLNSKFKSHIEVIINFSNTDILIKGNVGKLHQVFINILNNAFQSIENKGTVTVSTRINSNIVCIKISDTGHGIKESILPLISDPFFTTKDPGKGTGLGLSIAYNILKDHNGTIEFESELSKGTTVKIELPLG